MLSSSIDFSGEEMAYLYPDGRTTLLGTFHKEKMVQVKTAVSLKAVRASFIPEFFIRCVIYFDASINYAAHIYF